MKFLLIGLIRLYQLFLSPMLQMTNGGHGSCRHEPTCSNYAIEALRLHGAMKGNVLIAKRLLRCHPWGTYGHDPAPPLKKN